MCGQSELGTVKTRYSYPCLGLTNHANSNSNYIGIIPNSVKPSLQSGIL